MSNYDYQVDGLQLCMAMGDGDFVTEKAVRSSVTQPELINGLVEVVLSMAKTIAMLRHCSTQELLVDWTHAVMAAQDDEIFR